MGNDVSKLIVKVVKLRHNAVFVYISYLYKQHNCSIKVQVLRLVYVVKENGRTTEQRVS